MSCRCWASGCGRRAAPPQAGPSPARCLRSRSVEWGGVAALQCGRLRSADQASPKGGAAARCGELAHLSSSPAAKCTLHEARAALLGSANPLRRCCSGWPGSAGAHVHSCSPASVPPTSRAERWKGVGSRRVIEVSDWLYGSKPMLRYVMLLKRHTGGLRIHPPSPRQSGDTNKISRHVQSATHRPTSLDVKAPDTSPVAPLAPNTWLSLSSR